LNTFFILRSFLAKIIKKNKIDANYNILFQLSIIE